ncbi:MAG TPA: protein YhfH [Bacilli bacterium]|nr:protein YhfH [Bacilli bacterium]
MRDQKDIALQRDTKICVECGSEIVETVESLLYECERCMNNGDE